MKRKVRIRIESKQAEQVHVQRAQGELYHMNDSYYLRYAEPDPDMGRTTATVKWDEKQVKVIRHGDVESDLTFRSGTRTAGTYALPQGRMQLELVTHGIERKLSDGLGTLAWSYDMYTDGVYAGRIRLRLVIEEDCTE
ncbi:MAG: hypothetical protein K0R28_4420 [Paenibacillus sp.]|jgi:uncharacterized beta-barrel protein YwiB (DUF1934 family)|nr:hypothetical protein [Paenibacillus sp.]